MAVNGVEIEVGQVWQTRKGTHVTVHSIDADPTYPVSVIEAGADGITSVTAEGRVHATVERGEHDLVALVIPAPVRVEGAEAVPAERPHIDSGLKMLSEYEKAERDRAFVKSVAWVSGGGKLAGNHYYRVDVPAPISPEVAPYAAECADIIEALNMTFNEGEAFKALWRLAAARQGRAKAGGNPVYDADKVAHYGARTAAHTRAQNGGAA